MNERHGKNPWKVKKMLLVVVCVVAPILFVGGVFVIADLLLYK